MAVSINCSVCGKHLKDVTPAEFSKLTGEETCIPCGTKIKNTLKDIDESVAEAVKRVQEMVRDCKKQFDNYDKIYDKFQKDITSLLEDSKNKTQTKIDNVLKGEDNEVSNLQGGKV